MTSIEECYYVSECPNQKCKNIQTNYTSWLDRARFYCRKCRACRKVRGKYGFNVNILFKSNDQNHAVKVCKEIKKEIAERKVSENSNVQAGTRAGRLNLVP